MGKAMSRLGPVLTMSAKIGEDPRSRGGHLAEMMN
jgi:hypothetical protein